ncbi:MAG TPA: uracil-DNA glycosylase [Acholeplasmataceae bacterium]|jgi:uracil-DNA glycosylase|nr:uracil-DNA glycosylase [Acholeplasmataceae bacterium]
MKIGNNWDLYLHQEFAKEYYQNLRKFLIEEYRTKVIYPQSHDIYNALRYTDYEDIKAVILGQDPYPNPEQAHGLCFSVPEGIRIPPSLVNIFKELHNDLGCPFPSSGKLTKWAEEGVLLLNTVLTVRAKAPGSHRGQGWEILTQKIIEIVNQKQDPIVFILWGNDAKRSKHLITNPRHLILEGSHPSPLSAWSGFFGKGYFSKCNEFLISQGRKPIDWNLSV